MVHTRDFPTTSPQVPLTSTHPPAAPSLPEAGVARSSYAPRANGSLPKFYGQPEGQIFDGPGVKGIPIPEGEIWEDLHPDPQTKGMTTLQKHCAFWDREHKGYITPYDTFVGFRELGFNLLYSLAAVLVINLAFSYPTLPADQWFPDPRFRIYLSRVHRAHHGSDSQTYDPEGRYIPQRFEDIFSKYGEGTGEHATLDWDGMWRMLRNQRDYLDLFGMVGAMLEWLTMYALLWPEDGKMRKEDVRGAFDGSLFWAVRDRRRRDMRERKTAKESGKKVRVVG